MEKVALITGAAKRIGAVIARTLHQQGVNIIIHYHHSEEEAAELCHQFNRTRNNSAFMLAGDIKRPETCDELLQKAVGFWNRLDILVNNASSFYPTKLGEVNESEWEDLVGSNLKGPFFLSQAAAPYLIASKGNIVNIVDIHADRPLKNYPVYSIAKAGLVMLTKSLARELGPSVRVNAVAPGIILWPNEMNAVSDHLQDALIQKTALKRQGSSQDIADTVLFLTEQNYITGQVIAVDGGRSIKD